MHPSRTITGLPAVVLVLSATLAAQVELDTLDGAGPDDRFGNDVAGGVDLDGDGRDDYVVGAPEDDQAPVVILPGAVRAFAGGTGAPLWTAFGIQALSDFGWSVDLGGDLDGDGIGDVVAGAPRFDVTFTVDAGIVEARSGADGSLLWTSFGTGTDDVFGWDVSFTGDVDGDGVDDVVAGSLADYARVLSGANGATLRTETGVAGSRYGESVAGAGDLDADGVRDYLIGAPGHNGDWGAVEALSGATGTSLHFHEGGPGDSFGSRVAGLDDVDGDGRDDFMAVAPGGPYLRVDGGAPGINILLTINGPSTDRWGDDIACVGDMDGDGLSDVAIGWPHDPAGATFGGSVTVHSSATGAAVFAVDDTFFGEHFGYAVDAAGDSNADGVPDVIAGREQEFVEGIPGSARVITTCVGAFEVYGAGLAGAGGVVPAIGFSGCAATDDLVTVTTGGVVGGATGILFVGLNPLDIPAKGGALLTEILLQFLHVASGPAGVPGAGGAVFSATLPADPVFIGLSVFHQAWYGDPAAVAGISMTPGLFYTIVG